MKKTLLLLSTMAFGLGANAQTHSDLSANMKGSGEGYIWNFDGSDANNCSGSHATTDDASFTLSFANSHMTVTQAVGSVSTNGWWGTNLDMYSGDCSNDAINIGTGNDNLKMQFETSISVPEVYVYLCDATGKCTDKSPLGMTGVSAGTHTVDVSGFHWVTWDDQTVDSTNIKRVKIQFRSAWDATLDGTFNVAYISVGDQTGLTITSTEDEVVSNSLSVYPNPASSAVNVAFEASADAQVALSDLTGSSVAAASASKGINNISLDVSNVASGLYILSITTADGVVTRKVVVE